METVFERENGVLERLSARFGVDAEQAAVKTRRIYLKVSSEIFMEALKYLRNEVGFDQLCAITGLDTGDHFEFLYHIAEPGGILMTLEYETPREDPVVIPTVLPVYNGATFYERELEGLLGVKVEGLPEGRQYPLPDNWPAGEYPQRKDWKPGKKANSALQDGAKPQPTEPDRGV